MVNRNPDSQPAVSVTFRLTAKAYQELLFECGECGCSLSNVVRHAVMKEILHRRSQRKAAADHAVLLGQMRLGDEV